MRALQPGEQLHEVAVTQRRHQVPGVLLDQPPELHLLLPRQPAQLTAVGAELRGTPLHEGEHLEHPVVHHAGQPLALGRGGGGTLGAIPLPGHLLEQPGQEADDRAARR